LKPLLFQFQQSHINLRLNAMVTLGHIAIAVGKDAFAPYFPVGMQSVHEHIVTKTPQLLESRFLYYTNTAKVMKEDFAPFIPRALNEVTAMITDHRVVHVTDSPESPIDPTAAHETITADAMHDDNSDSDDYLDEDRDLINKKASVQALGSIAEHCPHAFYPLMSKAFADCMAVLLGSGPELLSSTMRLLSSFMTCTRKALQLPEKPAPGQPGILPQEAVSRLNSVLDIVVQVMERHHDPTPVATALECIAGIVKEFGCAVLDVDVMVAPDTFVKSLDRIVASLQLFLLEKAPCQQVDEPQPEEAKNGDDDNDVDDGEDEPDQSLQYSVAEVIEALSEAMGPMFAPIFEKIYPNLMRFTKPKRPYFERSWALGTIGDCMSALGPQCIVYAPAVLKLATQNLKDEMSGTRQNAAWMLGKFVAAAGSACSPHVKEMLQMLHPVCVRPAGQDFDTGGGDIDNALSAVCHIIRSCPSAVPLSMVLPAVLNALPLREDEDEGVNIFRCFVELLKASNVTAFAQYGAILALMGRELLPTANKSAKETKEYVRIALKELSLAPSPELFTAAWASMTDESIKIAVAEVLQT
jgi:hypothetical protein